MQFFSGLSIWENPNKQITQYLVENIGRFVFGMFVKTCRELDLYIGVQLVTNGNQCHWCWLYGNMGCRVSNGGDTKLDTAKWIWDRSIFSIIKPSFDIILFQDF